MNSEQLEDITDIRLGRSTRLILTMPDSPVDDLTFADSPVRSRAVRQGRRAALGQELDTGDQEDLDIGGVVDMVNPIFSRYLDISV